MTVGRILVNFDRLLAIFWAGFLDRQPAILGPWGFPGQLRDMRCDLGTLRASWGSVGGLFGALGGTCLLEDLGALVPLISLGAHLGYANGSGELRGWSVSIGALLCIMASEGSLHTRRI